MGAPSMLNTSIARKLPRVTVSYICVRLPRLILTGFKIRMSTLYSTRHVAIEFVAWIEFTVRFAGEFFVGTAVAERSAAEGG